MAFVLHLQPYSLVSHELNATVQSTCPERKHCEKIILIKDLFGCSQTGKQTFCFFTEQNNPMISNT